jgi:hypothetical protein
LNGRARGKFRIRNPDLFSRHKQRMQRLQSLDRRLGDRHKRRNIGRIAPRLAFGNREVSMPRTESMPYGIGKEIFRQSGHLSMMHDLSLGCAGWRYARYFDA